jgi:hypothetical protein
MSQALAGAERYAEAADVAREGLAAIAPFAETQPHAFGELARALGRSHVEACEKAGREPDSAMLKQMAKTLPGGREDEST